jgi:hypothetical protein
MAATSFASVAARVAATSSRLATLRSWMPALIS